MKDKEYPLHERLIIGVFLAAAAGGLDAYTYLFHGEVFAGLQTGNFILLGLNLGHGNFGALLRFIVPISAFFIGSVATRFLQHHLKDETSLRSRQKLVLIIEIILMLLTAFLSPYISDKLASALLSFAAAAQLQEFRKLHAGPFTSLMMTGNLRTLGETSWDAFIHHDEKAKAKFNDTAIVILSFVTSATLNSLLGNRLGTATIIVSAVVLVIPLFILHTKEN
ncbi:DUF1275 domain-containing protein [Enterococcus sp. MJM12]|uniref:DUF1275 domain-containing protein n=1 Tax=Candidatus Enterococcus myersii TaxID=2815322 RepID=A0ABS3H605_9ENTE|nr:YoaK family protein [Enterococcus sp. MJM12]MBO0448487.1 DUF1275 domain-containing protein [Enterococcus sp. MJM12]